MPRSTVSLGSTQAPSPRRRQPRSTTEPRRVLKRSTSPCSARRPEKEYDHPFVTKRIVRPCPRQCTFWIAEEKLGDLRLRFRFTPNMGQAAMRYRRPELQPGARYASNLDALRPSKLRSTTAPTAPDSLLQMRAAPKAFHLASAPAPLRGPRVRQVPQLHQIRERNSVYMLCF
jgi:hypothetical protein